MTTTDPEVTTMHTFRLSSDALTAIAEIHAATQRATAVHHVTVLVPDTDTELLEAADELGIDLGAPAPYWAGVTVETAAGVAHYLVGKHGEQRRPGGLGEPDWQLELAHAASAEIAEPPRPSALSIVNGTPARGGEMLADVAERIVDRIARAGHELLEAHGELVTLPIDAYGRCSFGLMDAVLSELESRIMAEHSHRVPS